MKQPGHCTLCEKKVLNPVLEDAWRVNFLLSDDTVCDITFCEDCLAEIPASLTRIWTICLERFDYEEEGRAKPNDLTHVHGMHLVKEMSRTRWTELA